MPRTVLLLMLWGGFVEQGSVSYGAEAPPLAVSRQLDAAFETLWTEQNVSPAALTDEATFLRRVSLDLTGTIPNVQQVRAFLSDQRPDKRQRLIEELSKTTAHSAHLAREWSQIMIPNQVFRSSQFEQWLFTRLQEGASWDKIATELIAPSAQGNPGAAFFMAGFESKPEKLADATARVFLGLQMGCAECHDHPFGQWSREEFWSLAAFFADAPNNGQNLEVFGRSGRLRVIKESQPRTLIIPDTDKVAIPRFPGSQDVIEPTNEPIRRQLAAWLVAAENPWFAKATVNRVWSLLFGRGLVEPVDDLTAAENAFTQDVLNLLAKDFIASGYNVKRLIEVIVSTRVYQLASHSGSPAAVRPELFHVMAVRSLTAHQIYECLLRAVAGRHRSLQRPDAEDLAEQRQFVQRLTAPTQSATEFQAGIPQMLTLLNGSLVAKATDVQKCDLLAGLRDGPFFSDEDRIEILYLTTLTRPPTAAELRRAGTFLAQRREAGSHGQEIGDLLWVLLNSSEFLLNH